MALVDDDERRSTRKRWAIVEAATEAFLRSGYLGTSMDEIAAAAGVSKQTVYKHFADKERLFSEIVTSTVSEAGDPVHAEVQHLQDSGDLDADLRDLARRQLALVLQPRILQLRRLVIAEAARFPELGRTFYEKGPGRTMAALATAFERLAARGLLTLDDPGLAAAQFNWLVMSAPLNQAMLLGDFRPPEPADLARWADDGVRMFLAAYGAAPDTPPTSDV
jgi:AcrR family transcriptional regulator